MKEKSKVISENKERLAALFEPYDPIMGIGSPVERHKLEYYDDFKGQNVSLLLPVDMFGDNLVAYLYEVKSISGLFQLMGIEFNEDGYDHFVKEFNNIRFKYDIEFWAATKAHIQDKDTKEVHKFILNKPQRKYLKKLEGARVSGAPGRFNLLKARQWGGSTLTELYFAWIQTELKENWHSAICADVEDQAKNIRGMYSRFAKEYPAECGTITMKPYEKSGKNIVIAERGNIIGVGSMQEPENLRSYDFSMVHLSEVGSWKTTKMKKPEDLVQNLRSLVPYVPYTFIILESTAKGVGNFWHREYNAAKEKRSGYEAIFVAWWEIERYQMPVDDYEAFIDTWGQYEWFLWGLGATIEGIKWYKEWKRSGNYDDWRMASEYPSTDQEAFQSTGRRVFSQGYVQRMRKHCQPPSFIGDLYGKANMGPDALEDIHFETSPGGSLYIWSKPDMSMNIRDRYCVSVDIGGRTEGADFSTIRVIDRYLMIEAGVPEAIATWRGHIDQDMLGWIAARIAKWYNTALLVVESNSLRTDTGGSEGDHVLTILDQISKHYGNIYYRTDPEKIKQGIPVKYGFHTNQKTKILVIDGLNGAIRDDGYIERDVRVCDEMDCYEVKDDGSYGAVDGEHDDLVMATSIGYYVSTSIMMIPVIIMLKQITRNKIRKSEAMI